MAFQELSNMWVVCRRRKRGFNHVRFSYIFLIMDLQAMYVHFPRRFTFAASTDVMWEPAVFLHGFCTGECLWSECRCPHMRCPMARNYDPLCINHVVLCLLIRLFSTGIAPSAAHLDPLESTTNKIPIKTPHKRHQRCFIKCSENSNEEEKRMLNAARIHLNL